MEILSLNHLDTEKMQQVERLLRLLSPDADPLNLERLNQLLKDGHMRLFAAENKEKDIVGILSLCVCPTLAKDKLWIEDVVVDESYRGSGIGRQLIQAAIAYAKSNCTVAMLYLTSNPTRKAARALYTSEGFEEYETGVFRMKP